MRKFLSPFPCFVLGYLCWAIGFSTACSNGASSVEEVTVGGIAGSVSDQTTGEPVATVNVTLSPGGRSTVTGSDGSFSFVDLAHGAYTIDIHKEGYNPNSKTVEVVAGQQTSAHLLIERIPAIVTADRNELDFGENDGVNTLSFGIVNSSYEDLSWQIEHDCKWIKEIRPTKGVLKLGKTETIVVIIDRELLASGNNETVIVIRSTNGRAEVKIKATGAERRTPELNTLAATNIMVSSAVLNGRITNPGIPIYTERGFFYSTSKIDIQNIDENPDVVKVSSPVTENPEFSYTITGLTLEKTYYVRAYAINPNGRVISTNEVSFQPAIVAPVVEITETSMIDISRAAATLNGVISFAGSPTYTEKGFVYSNTSSPTIDDNKIRAEGKGEGNYSATVTNLTLNKVFYVKAYAIQQGTVYYSEGTTYFAVQPIASSVGPITISEIGVNAVKLTASIIKSGVPEYTERGFVLNTNSNPNIENNIKKVVVEKNDSETFSARMNGLSANTLYYVRAYVRQQDDTYYGEEKLFNTGTSLPSVYTNAATNTTYTSATLQATIYDRGDPAYNHRGFYYGTSSYLSPTNRKMVIEDANSSDVYSMTVSDLEEGLIYYYQPFLMQQGNSEPILGQIFSFKTRLKPSIVTGGVLDGTLTCSGTTEQNLRWSGTFYGGSDFDGDPAYTEFGFVYGTTNLPVVDDGSSSYLMGEYVTSKNGLKAYQASATGMMTNVHYHVRAVAKTSLGYVYSEPVEFMPTVVAPAIRTYSTECNQIDSEWAVALVGVAGSLGQPTATGLGFVYGSNPLPTVGDGSSIAVSYTKIETQSDGYKVFGTAVYGLMAGQNYYVRAYAKTQLGYTYGDVLNFKTY